MNKKLILKIALIILLIVILIGIIYLLVNRENKKDYIIVYLKDEYKESNLSDIKNLKGVSNVSYTSNKDLYKQLGERINSLDFSLVFNEDDFNGIIVAEVKHNSNKKIIEDIDNLGFTQRSTYANNIYEQVLADLAVYTMYLKVDISDEEFDKVYDFAKNIDGVYDVKKVTKEEALELAKKNLGTNADMISKYEKQNPFSSSVTFKISNIDDYNRIEDTIKSYMKDNETVKRYSTNASTLKKLIDDLHEKEKESKDK